VKIALTSMRRNRVQEELAETFATSQSTISRTLQAMTPLIEEVTAAFVPTGDDLQPDVQYIIDGTLLPCWTWSDHPELFSGKHHTTGYNVQVACTMSGQPAWIGHAEDGCHHDTWALHQSGILDTLDPINTMGDRGYIGNHMITPIKKQPGGQLLDWQKEFNTAVNKIRYQIERTIANIKTCRILHTDYRRPLATFKQTINAVIGLIFWLTA